MSGVSNRAFADVAGCSPTMASRLRNGKRRPSGDQLIKIIREFELDESEALAAYGEGAEAFGSYLRTTVFNLKERVSERA